MNLAHRFATPFFHGPSQVTHGTDTENASDATQESEAQRASEAGTWQWDTWASLVTRDHWSGDASQSARRSSARNASL